LTTNETITESRLWNPAWTELSEKEKLEAIKGTVLEIVAHLKEIESQ